MKIFAARRNHFEARDRATSKHIERKRHARKKGEIQITQPRSKHKGRQTHADTDRRKQTDTSKQTKHKQTHTHKNRHTQWTDTNTPHAHTNIQTNEHIHRPMDTLGLLPRRDSKRLRLSGRVAAPFAEMQWLPQLDHLLDRPACRAARPARSPCAGRAKGERRRKQR